MYIHSSILAKVADSVCKKKRETVSSGGRDAHKAQSYASFDITVWFNDAEEPMPDTVGLECSPRRVHASSIAWVIKKGGSAIQRS